MMQILLIEDSMTQAATRRAQDGHSRSRHSLSERSRCWVSWIRPVRQGDAVWTVSD